MKKSTQIISYLSYITVFLATLFFAMFYLRPFFFLLLLLVICLPFFSYFLTRYIFLRLEPLVYIKPFSTTKNQEALLTVSVENKTPFPVSSAILPISFRALYYKEETKAFHVFPLRGKSENSLCFPLQLTKNGLYEATVTDLYVFDYLHLFRLHKTLSLNAQIRVYPNNAPVEKRHDALYSEGFDEFEESGKSGNVSSNVTDIREYRPGDRLQKIHWKLSTKVDKLMVKENEATSTNEFFLLMELFQPDKDACNQNPVLLNALDDAIEEAWAVSMELIEQQEIFVFATYSSLTEDFVMSTICSKEDLENALFESYFHPTYETENLALDVYERSGQKKGTLLHITHKGVEDVPT